MNVPKLRFKEFDGEWEEKDIIHIAQDEKSAVKIGPFGSQLRKEYLQSAGLYKVYGQENVFNNDFSQGNRFLNEERFNLLKSSEIISGDIVISMMGTIGKIAEVPSNIQVGIMDSHLIRIRLDNQKYLNSFFIQVMNSTILKKQIEKLSVGSIMSGLSSKVIKTLQFPYTKIEEQKKISKFLNLLDKKIQLQQQKIDLLQEQKKGFLQKMFPKNGETVPELRFDGFTGDWKEQKLREIGKTQSGIGFPDVEQGGSEGVPFFKVSDMNIAGNEYEMITSNNYVSDEQLKRKKWRPIETVPAVIFAKVGAAIMLNRKRLVRTPFLIDNNTMAYVFDESWDTDFGKILFETVNLPKYAQVGALPSYNGSDIENIEVKVTNKDEQVKIGLFFNRLEHIINLHQHKLDLLEKQKKGFMQQMFI